ncbi:MAG TPA: PspC domain-containing protein [Sphingomicrobium sp.]|jgi:phage shock protein PspC (stress-responsive transcriptional regulator)|nr:PspC domain-containing protein [Sphingomicrobium sp.]
MKAKQNPFLRADTLFGVCQAIGEDFGINPLWLRIPLASAILFTPTGAIGAYFALGALVLISRLLFPPKPVVTEAVILMPALAASTKPVEQDTRELAEAA